MRQTLIRNARLIDPDSGSEQHGDLLIEEGRIAAVGTQLARPHEAVVVDAGGVVVTSGLVDMRAQLREPGEEHKETIRSGLAAAAAGGVTSLVCLPTTNPVIDDVSVVEFVARRGREMKGTKLYCFAAATKGLQGEQISEMGLLQESGACGFTDGERVIQDAAVMTRVLKYASGFEALVIQHAQDEALGVGDMNQGALADRLGLVGIPTAAEAIIVERDIRLLANTGGKCHFAHISTAAALEAIRRAQRDGLQVTCDTAPHYFILEESAVGSYRTFAKVMPPLRSEADRQAVEAAVLDGTISCIASDHTPQDQDTKRLPFSMAGFGMIGLETLLPLSLTLHHEKGMELAALLARLSTHPARLVGIEGGTLKVGQPADLILFDPNAEWTVREKDMRSKSKNTPFDGMKVRGLVLKTWVDGRIVFDRDNDRDR